MFHIINNIDRECMFLSCLEVLILSKIEPLIYMTFQDSKTQSEKQLLFFPFWLTRLKQVVKSKGIALASKSQECFLALHLGATLDISTLVSSIEKCQTLSLFTPQTLSQIEFNLLNHNVTINGLEFTPTVVGLMASTVSTNVFCLRTPLHQPLPQYIQQYMQHYF